ncbi:phytoene/squalene synthase family protein [Roseospira visakhapatnamensis]|uniref:Phytoene synthase n=1 Tax=Roseospira visakhapatnamensis TaxID=390880 RepID=A0A7W6W919_9PROT|nr:phytoene/squalene synthase family protein [Roseospira visakhapatnamensis]MBB4265444.1 phytoene synthase [Roseospira visakhapatnamensis]
MQKPWSERPDLASPQDRTQCRALIKTGSRSFFAASLLLPPAMRDPAYALYGFCRLSDDAVDESDACLQAVSHLRHRLDLIYAGTPMDNPVDRAFADVVERHALPRTLPDALLEGFEWDARGRDYETISEVRAYGARVASTVGAMMSVLMGARQPHVLARACDLGVAMQLTNIARDVGEDARNGRLYLPRQWMVEAGLDPEAFLARPRFTPALGVVVRRLLAEADRLYDRAASGIAGLPAGCRPAIHAARLIYAGIGTEIAQAGYDSVSRRAYVPGRRKLALVANAVRDTAVYRSVAADPALAETHFLVDAAAFAPNIWVMARQPAAEQQSYGERVFWALELMSRLEERRRAA